MSSAKEQYSLDLIELFVGDVVLVLSGCNNDNDNMDDVEPELAVVASIDTTTSYHNGDETSVCLSRRITLHPDNVRADFDSNGVSPSMQIIARCDSCGNLLKFDGMERPRLITIRNVLKEKLPESVPTTAALIANVRVRLKKMLFSLQTEEDDKQRQRNNLLKLTTEESNKLMDDAQADAEKGTLCSDELNHTPF
eukprot:scaffold46_cov77-Skeletonema_dohrnii-CCMP3373.AAC.2